MDGGALWRAVSSDGCVRAEIWVHAAGWECRVYVDDALACSLVFVDPRDAHLEALEQIRQRGIVKQIATGRPENHPPAGEATDVGAQLPDAARKRRRRPGP